MNDHIALLKRCFLFQHLPEQQLAGVASEVTVRSFARGSEVLTQDQPGRALFVIVSGVAKVVMHGAHGRKNTLAYLNRGDAFGEISMFSGTDCTADVTASTDLTVLELPKEKLLDLFAKSSDFAYAIVRTLCERIRDTDALVNDLAFKNLEGRVAAKLLNLAEKFGEPTNGSVLIALPITHIELADLVGTSRETVTKIIGLLRKEGSISIEDGQITILDIRKLRVWTEQ
jgi:CRP/FNR family cyclic AMP-dependent transcriptional regulator